MSNQSSRRELDGIFELGAAFVGTTARLGLTIFSAPLILLPKGSRRRVRRAMAEVARAVVALPRELANVSERVVDDMYSGNNTPSVEMPSGADLRNRARAFTERLSRAADEFGSAAGRAVERTADNAEEAAAKVDEWVERRDKPTI